MVVCKENCTTKNIKKRKKKLMVRNIPLHVVLDIGANWQACLSYHLE